MSDSGGWGRAGEELMAEQFHLKVLHAVLAVRSPRPLAAPAPPAAASASFRRRDRWFHLALHDPPPPPSAERLEAPPPGDPLVVDIHLAPAGSGGAGGEVVERWTVAWEPWPDAAAAGEGIAVNRAYKGCMTLLRAVYATLRLLPAYRVFHVLRRASESYKYEMCYRVGSFAVPFSLDEEATMRFHRFVPVDMQPGRLVVSVQYLSSLAGFKLEIPNYTHSWVQPALLPHAPAQQTRFSPPPLHYASPTPSSPNFPGGYLQSPLRGSWESAPVTIPGVRGVARPQETRAMDWDVAKQSSDCSHSNTVFYCSPVHRQNMLDPMRPPPSPRGGDKGPAGSQESLSDISRSFGRLRMGDQYGSLSPGYKQVLDIQEISSYKKEPLIIGSTEKNRIYYLFYMALKALTRQPWHSVTRDPKATLRCKEIELLLHKLNWSVCCLMKAQNQSPYHYYFLNTSLVVSLMTKKLALVALQLFIRECLSMASLL